MFYEKQPKENQDNYKKMLEIIGSLTALFSESDCPYLSYRVQENVFSKYFDAQNIARSDCSADAKKDKIGIGLKTWMGQDDQKVAEFDKLRKTFAGLSGMALITKIAEYRNERIRVTKNMYGIDEMIYHVVKRIPGTMQILECAFDPIDIPNIVIDDTRGNNNNTYFTDGKHTYHFSESKNTLYMIFDCLTKYDEFPVTILNDPYQALMRLVDNAKQPETAEAIVETIEDYAHEVSLDKKPQVCLRLYSTKSDGTKFVPDKSGLNQWNALGRKRDPNEVYIPYPAIDRSRTRAFFPDRDTIFNLKFPDGSVIPSKVCQQDDKAIMSNPNKALGKWLLRDVFGIPEGTLVTYEMLEKFGVDSVVFTKNGENDYAIEFSEIGTYEKFYKYVEDED